MSDSGSGQRNDPPDRPGNEGYSGPASWESSLNTGDGDPTRSYESPPNPFSREGSAGSSSTGSSASSAGSAPDYSGYGPSGQGGQGGGPAEWPTYPATGAGPAQPPPQQSYPPYEQQPQPYQPYEQQPQPYQPYEQQQPPFQAYEQQPPPYQPYEQQAMPSYGAGANPYEASPYPVNPYQGYGVPQNHPQAVTALVLGIVGLVVCPLVGIAGIVLGGKARKEIDADPQRYTGRSTATAGWVLGIISVVYLAVLLVIFVAAGVTGALDS